MKLKCLLNFHKWNGCQCDLCGKTRDENHNWLSDCEKCEKCGKLRDGVHSWSGCKCTECGKTRDKSHDWNGCKCRKCGVVRNDNHDWSQNCEKCAICNTKRVGYSHKWVDNRCSICGIKDSAVVYQDTILNRGYVLWNESGTKVLALKADPRCASIMSEKSADTIVGLQVVNEFGGKTTSCCKVYLQEAVKNYLALNNSQEKESSELLFSAIRNSGIELVRRYIESGGDPNLTSPDGDTALILAADNGQTEIINLLLKSGARPNDTDISGYTALMAAVRLGHLTAVECLISGGADVNARTGLGDSTDPTSGFTALMLAALRKQSRVIEPLVKAGSDINAKVSGGVLKGLSVLDLAMLSKSSDVIDLLRQLGAR